MSIQATLNIGAARGRIRSGNWRPRYGYRPGGLSSRTRVNCRKWRNAAAHREAAVTLPLPWTFESAWVLVQIGAQLSLVLLVAGGILFVIVAAVAMIIHDLNM